jgi:hypothetical protein
MSGLVLGTNVVSMDEYAYSLKELIQQSPGNRGWHRYMIVKVPRNGKLVEFRKDLGAARKWKNVQEFSIIGAIPDYTTGRVEWVHTVGELVDIADWMRDPTRQKLPPPQPFDFVSGYHDEQDKKKLRQRKRSMVGPVARVQRD